MARGLLARGLLAGAATPHGLPAGQVPTESQPRRPGRGEPVNSCALCRGRQLDQPAARQIQTRLGGRHGGTIEIQVEGGRALLAPAMHTAQVRPWIPRGAALRSTLSLCRHMDWTTDSQVIPAEVT